MLPVAGRRRAGQIGTTVDRSRLTVRRVNSPHRATDLVHVTLVMSQVAASASYGRRPFTNSPGSTPRTAAMRTMLYSAGLTSPRST